MNPETYGYMTVCRILRPGAEITVHAITDHPEQQVVYINEPGALLSIHIRSNTADVAERIAAAFIGSGAPGPRGRESDGLTMRREDLRDVPVEWLRDELKRREGDERVRALLAQHPKSVLLKFVKPAELRRA